MSKISARLPRKRYSQSRRFQIVHGYDIRHDVGRVNWGGGGGWGGGAAGGGWGVGGGGAWGGFGGGWGGGGGAWGGGGGGGGWIRVWSDGNKPVRD